MTFDWPTIRARYEAGESCSAISRSLDGRPTKQAISQRQNREGWARPELVDPVDGENHALMVAPAMDKLTFEQQQVILKVSEGWTQRMAAGYAMVNESTVSEWKKKPEFQQALSLALAVKSGRRLAKIEAAPDWRAALALLERDPDSRGEFAPANQQSGNFNIGSMNVLGRLSLGIERSVESIEQTKKEQG